MQATPFSIPSQTRLYPATSTRLAKRNAVACIDLRLRETQWQLVRLEVRDAMRWLRHVIPHFRRQHYSPADMQIARYIAKYHNITVTFESCELCQRGMLPMVKK